jgi:hypothetical protein
MSTYPKDRAVQETEGTATFIDKLPLLTNLYREELNWLLYSLQLEDYMKKSRDEFESVRNALLTSKTVSSSQSVMPCSLLKKQSSD